LLAAPATEVIVKTGDPAPDGDGTFDMTFAGDTIAALNNCGWAGFTASIKSTMTLGRGAGLFLGNGTALKQVARTNDPAPGGKLLNFGDLPALNDAGQLLFISNTVVNSRVVDLFRSEPNRAITRLFTHDQPAPGGNGTVSIADANQPPAFNQAGKAAFVARLANTSGGSSDDSAIYSTSTGGQLTQIVREGQNVPGGNGKFGQLSFAELTHVVLNKSGQVVFYADLTGTIGGSSDNSGVYRGNGNTLTKIARAGDGVLGGGTLLNFCCDTSPDPNDSGEVVFRSFNNYAGFGKFAILKGSGGPLAEIARIGDAIPGDNDTFNTFNGYNRINNPGQVAFIARIASNPPSGFGSGIFRGSGTVASRITVARDGQATPDRAGIFSNFLGSPFCLNNAGQIAFLAGLDIDTSNNTPVEEQGIYFFDGSKLLKVARQNDPFLGSTITGLALDGTSQTPSGGTPGGGVASPERSGLNEAGQVAFGFALADNRRGIAIWSPSLKLLCASSRKIHGTNKTFDFELPLSGKLGVECRSGGAQGDFTLVLQFTNKLSSVGITSVTTGMGSVSGTPTINGNTMTVNLTGVANAQKVVVTVNNVTDPYGRTLAKAAVPIGILLGDVDGNKTVDNKDVNAVSGKVGASVSQTTFRDDVNVTGKIDQTDVNITQGQVGMSIP